MEKVLITGTAGFIGFHLAKSLLDDGYEVIGIDNFSDYYDIRLKEKRNDLLLKYPNYEFYKINIEQFDKLNKVISASKVKMIVHLAAQAGVRYSLTNPWIYESTNGLGTLNIFESAKQNKVKRVLFASSSSIYGTNKKSPFSEKDVTETPISLYAATKKGNELMAHAYHHLNGIEMAGFRFFTVYGPYGRPDMALFIFAKNILSGKEIEVFNKGNMERDFTYVDDIIAGLRGAMTIEKLKFEIFNIGAGNPVGLMKFIDLIEKNFGLKAKKKYLPMQPGDVKKTFADIAKAKKYFNYQPKIQIEEGIKNFCDWFEQDKDFLLSLK